MQHIKRMKKRTSKRRFAKFSIHLVLVIIIFFTGLCSRDNILDKSDSENRAPFRGPLCGNDCYDDRTDDAPTTPSVIGPTMTDLLSV